MMKVRDLMIKNVVTIGAEDSIKNAIKDGCWKIQADPGPCR
jgi:hypothetical protein